MDDDEVFNSDHLRQVVETPIASSTQGPKITLHSPVVKRGLVSSTPRLVPQPVLFDLSKIPDIETSGKDTESEAEGIPNIGTQSWSVLYPQRRRARQDTSMQCTAGS